MADAAAVHEISGEGSERPRGDRMMASFFLGGRTPRRKAWGRRPTTTLFSHLVRRPLEVRPREHVQRPLRRRHSRVGRHLFELDRLFCALLRAMSSSSMCLCASVREER